MTKKCKGCGKNFEAVGRAARYCPSCRIDRQREYRKKWYKETAPKRREWWREYREKNAKRLREYARLYKRRSRQRKALEDALEGDVDRDPK